MTPVRVLRVGVLDSEQSLSGLESPVILTLHIIQLIINLIFYFIIQWQIYNGKDKPWCQQHMKKQKAVEKQEAKDTKSWIEFQGQLLTLKVKSPRFESLGNQASF